MRRISELVEFIGLVQAHFPEGEGPYHCEFLRLVIVAGGWAKEGHAHTFISQALLS